MRLETFLYPRGSPTWGISRPLLAHVGEGRRYFAHAFTTAMGDAGINGHRRNVELLARGLINHVRLTDEYGPHAPGEVTQYGVLEHHYKPRADAVKRSPHELEGHFS